MSHHSAAMRGEGGGQREGDSAPGEATRHHADVGAEVRGYVLGLAIAAALTAGSFILSYSKLVYGPALGTALIVFAVAQIGIHLVFFLHMTTAPDNINNAMALAFGVLMMVLLIGGTLWIMSQMNNNMMPMSSSLPMTPSMSTPPASTAPAAMPSGMKM